MCCGTREAVLSERVESEHGFLGSRGVDVYRKLSLCGIRKHCVASRGQVTDPVTAYARYLDTTHERGR